MAKKKQGSKGKPDAAKLDAPWKKGESKPGDQSAEAAPAAPAEEAPTEAPAAAAASVEAATEEPAASGAEAASSAEEPAASGEKPASSAEEPAASGEEPAASASATPGEPLRELMAALATASERMQGAEGAEVRQRVGEVRQRVSTLVETLKEKSEEAERSRKEAAAELDQLIAAVAETGAAAGRAIEKQRASIKQAFGGVEMAALAEGLHRFADWLANPSEAKEADVKRVIDRLEATIGPAIGWDPQKAQEAADEQRRAEIRASVQASLDSIFRPKKPE